MSRSILLSILAFHRLPSFMANGDPSNDPTNKTLSTYSSSQAAACVCLMNFNNTVDNVTTDGTTTAPVSSASSSDQDDRFSGISGGQTPTNTLMMTNNSNKIVFSCNNTLGQTTYHNATPDLFTHIVNLYNNKTYTSHLTGKKIGQNNATTTFTNYVFKKTIAENVTNYLDFWECYALANATYLVENKIASVPPAITISHILLTAIVLMLAYMINACMTLTRQRFLRRAIAELPRIKQIFTPSLIKKISNSNYLQIVNEATRARTIGKKIVQHQTHEFQHLGSSFHQKRLNTTVFIVEDSSDTANTLIRKDRKRSKINYPISTLYIHGTIMKNKQFHSLTQVIKKRTARINLISIYQVRQTSLVRKSRQTHLLLKCLAYT